VLNAIPETVPLNERVIIRFGATLFANLLRAGFSFFSGILIARGLGASSYGDLNFLIGSFVAVSQLLELGTSSAFYTFISQRRRGWTFFALYFGYLSVQFVVIALLLGVLFPARWIELIWVGHERGIVLLAFVSSFLTTQMWGVVSQLGEATRRTVMIQLGAISQGAVHLALIAAAAHWGWLTVHAVMWLLGAEYCLLALWLVPKLVKENMLQIDEEEPGVITKEFASYCGPLVLYGFAGFLYDFADRWLLQQFGGPEQQGYFSISQQFANISLLVTTSVLKIFWKEVADARERGDHERIRQLYQSVARGLFFVGAWTSCLLIPYSREILAVTVGPEYAAAWFTLAVLFLLPVYQSLGQLGGTFFYASGATATWTRISLVRMGISIPVTYWVLAPPSASVPGFGLGAVGLAAKLVVLAVIGVNVQNYLIARRNGITFEYRSQVIVLAVMLGLGWASKWGAENALRLIGNPDSPTALAWLGGVIYVSLSLALLYRHPGLAGLSREKLRGLASVVLPALRSSGDRLLHGLKGLGRPAANGR
jgi:O-antigen/teichoic acid export membrane protein